MDRAPSSKQLTNHLLLSSHQVEHFESFAHEQRSRTGQLAMLNDQIRSAGLVWSARTPNNHGRTIPFHQFAIDTNLEIFPLARMYLKAQRLLAPAKSLSAIQLPPLHGVIRKNCSREPTHVESLAVRALFPIQKLARGPDSN